MTRERWDRVKAIGMIVALLGIGTVQACNRAPPEQKSESQLKADLLASADNARPRRQRMIDEASVVCRDGMSYLIGDTSTTWVYGGPFAVPYYRNGYVVQCTGEGIVTPKPEKKEL